MKDDSHHIKKPTRRELRHTKPDGEELWTDMGKHDNYGSASTMIDFTGDGQRIVTVTHADDIIGVAATALATGSVSLTKDGWLVLDTAGEYVYLPLCFAERGTVVICERVR